MAYLSPVLATRGRTRRLKPGGWEHRSNLRHSRRAATHYHRVASTTDDRPDHPEDPHPLYRRGAGGGARVRRSGADVAVARVYRYGEGFRAGGFPGRRPVPSLAPALSRPVPSQRINAVARRLPSGQRACHRGRRGARVGLVAVEQVEQQRPVEQLAPLVAREPLDVLPRVDAEEPRVSPPVSQASTSRRVRSGAERPPMFDGRGTASSSRTRSAAAHAWASSSPRSRSEVAHRPQAKLVEPRPARRTHHCRVPARRAARRIAHDEHCPDATHANAEATSDRGSAPASGP